MMHWFHASSNVAARLNARPMSVALATVLGFLRHSTFDIRHSPNILLIPETSSMEHLREHVANAALQLPHDAIKDLNAIAG